MLLGWLGGALLGAAGTLAWGVRGKSSSLVAPSHWRGPREHRAIALTFDDGPSESTERLLDLLSLFGVRATFFQCGQAVRRLPAIARQVEAAGHEIGNHTDSHPLLCFRSAAFILSELQTAQQAIEDTTGVRPRVFRPPFGARWFGLRTAQERLQLQGVMWSAIGRDWTLDSEAIVRRLMGKAEPGAIICLHDGRVLKRNPDIRPTIEAVNKLIPAWQDAGYEFCTVSDLLGLSR